MLYPDAKFNDEEILRDYLAKSDTSTDVDDEIPNTLSKYKNRTARISDEEVDEATCSATVQSSCTERN